MRLVDLAVILAYLIAITGFGARFRKGQSSLRDYFLGGRTAPWWAIALSIVSAETSTLTIVGTPGLAFAGDLGFLQLVFGYLLARIVISVIFLPQYFRGEMYTAYELMRRRFGERMRRITASIFLVTRALAEGVRVFAVSLVISIVLGTGEMASIILIVGLTLFYTFEGGMTAVIWTDVVQMGLYVAGAVVSLAVILAQVPGGLAHVWAIASAAGKLHVFNFGFSPSLHFFSGTYTFWAGLLGGCFLTMASHGTDQLMVQRLLSARDLRQSRLALLASWVVIFFQFSLFLAIGVALFVYYQDASLVPPHVLDRIYPEFVWRHLPTGIAGLVMAAILAAAMANLSAALNSLASTTVVDFARKARPRSEAGALRFARGMTVLWGAILVAIGMLARHWGSVLESGLSIASVTLGLLLGVFLLGVLTRRVHEWAALAGLLAGLAAILYVRSYTPIAWTWWVLIGSTVTFLAGYAASFLPLRAESA
ncbi:MAG TPA: sodium:solute symporter [Bryobacteraceae bacterium]|nr:sodium:solute symporter [Bryobacteraceae bacterium]